MDKEEAQYMKEIQDLLWQAYGVLLDMPYGNPHRPEAIKIAGAIVELLEERHLTSSSSSATEAIGTCHRCHKNAKQCICEFPLRAEPPA